MASPLLGTFTQGDARWQKMRARGLADLYYFASAILGLEDKIPMRPATHLLLCRFLEGKTGSPLLDQARYKKIEMPRETGKSSLLRARAIQRICQNPEIAILLVNEKELLVKDFLAAIKYELETNELLRVLYPDVVPPDLNGTTWSATRIVVNRQTGRPDPTIDVAGVGAALAGKHPDAIYCDDVISREAMENARAGSWQIMHQTNRWINQLDPIVNKSALPFPETVFCGTRWFHNDSYEHIEEAYGGGEPARPVLLRATLPDGTVQQLTAYRKGDLAIFRRAAIEDGRSIFPEKWSLEDLAKMRVRDPELFAANYLNNPADNITATFKQEWRRYFHWIDDRTCYFLDGTGTRQIRALQDLDLIAVIDPGGFGQGQDDRMRAAGWVLGDDGRGNYLQLDCYSEKDTYLAAIRHFGQWAERYPIRKFYVERAGTQVAFAQLLREHLARDGTPTPVDDTTLKPGNATGHANKDLRILEMEPYYQRGQVYTGTGPQFHEFEQQYAQFPRAKRVDLLDILGYWPRLLRKTSTGRLTSPAQRQAHELALYRQRRGIA